MVIASFLSDGFRFRNGVAWRGIRDSHTQNVRNVGRRSGRVSLRFEKDRQNTDSFRGFIEKCRLFSNRSESLCLNSKALCLSLSIVYHMMYVVKLSVLFCGRLRSGILFPSSPPPPPPLVIFYSSRQHTLAETRMAMNRTEFALEEILKLRKQLPGSMVRKMQALWEEEGGE